MQTSSNGRGEKKRQANNYSKRWFLLIQEKLVILGAEGELNQKSKFWRKKVQLKGEIFK